MERGCVSDGVMAQDSAQMAGIWAVCERITEALQRDGWAYGTMWPTGASHLQPVEAMRERVQKLAIRCVGFGHLRTVRMLRPGHDVPGIKETGMPDVFFIPSGRSLSGNLHLNVTSSEADEALLALIEPFIYEYTSHYRGSISAEHGLGLLKAKHMVSEGSAGQLARMGHQALTRGCCLCLGAFPALLQVC